MVTFVFGLAIVNLSLGYLTARMFADPPLFRGLRLRFPARRSAPAASQNATAPASSSAPGETAAAVCQIIEVPPALPPIAAVNELPEDWLVKLAAEGIVAQSFVEGVAHAIRLEIGQYREQLVSAECRTRSLSEDGDAAGLARVADDLRALNQTWLDQQTQAADLLTERSGRLGDHEKAASALEQELLDQAAHIRSSCGALETIEESPDAAPRSKRLLEQLTLLLVHAHALRDRILDLLATMMAGSSALESFGPALQRDALTRLPNRIGLDSLLAAWRSDGQAPTRLLSAIFIDLDRFSRINQRLGTRTGDGAIIAMARLFEEALAGDRGFERVVRIGGQTFMILQGDVGPHQALTAAERLRQSVEATTFDDEGVEFDLTISCGVIEVKHGESSLELVQRGQETLKFAKKAGRNRCALDKGEGPTMIDPPQFTVKARIVSLRAALQANGSPAERDPQAPRP